MLRVSRSPSLLLRQWVPLHPVFDPKPFHTPKFARIVADEHIPQKQSRRRSETMGCLRAAMKSSEPGGQSKNESQEWSAGLIIRLRPILVISTGRPPAGKATGLGRRTAWLRLVVKTVERAIMTPIGIYQWDIRDPPVAVK